MFRVALRKESVDRNILLKIILLLRVVALRKESVDRKADEQLFRIYQISVALRKESVDRKGSFFALHPYNRRGSLSARRAWIEKDGMRTAHCDWIRRSPQGERG